MWSVLVLPTSADPGTPPADSITYEIDNANSSMTVFGSSNVRDWTMDVTEINGSVGLDATEDGLPEIHQVRIEVPVEQMTSDKDRLQRHAHEALKKEDHPIITFTASDIQVATADADSFSVTATGDLTIAGEMQSITLAAKGAQQQDGTFRIKGEHQLTLSTYHVERPSLMFGTIKVDDPVRIGFDVVLTASSTPAQN